MDKIFSFNGIIIIYNYKIIYIYLINYIAFIIMIFKQFNNSSFKIFVFSVKVFSKLSLISFHFWLFKTALYYSILFFWVVKDSIILSLYFSKTLTILLFWKSLLILFKRLSIPLWNSTISASVWAKITSSFGASLSRNIYKIIIF